VPAARLHEVSCVVGVAIDRQRTQAFAPRAIRDRADNSSSGADLSRSVGLSTIATATGRRRLGDLYNPDDYPPQFAGLFGIEWNLPSVDGLAYTDGS
jgi:hypothetical protein